MNVESMKTKMEEENIIEIFLHYGYVILMTSSIEQFLNWKAGSFSAY